METHFESYLFSDHVSTLDKTLRKAAATKSMWYRNSILVVCTRIKSDNMHIWTKDIRIDIFAIFHCSFLAQWKDRNSVVFCHLTKDLSLLPGQFAKGFLARELTMFYILFSHSHPCSRGLLRNKMKGYVLFRVENFGNLTHFTWNKEWRREAILENKRSCGILLNKYNIPFLFGKCIQELWNVVRILSDIEM